MRPIRNISTSTEPKYKCYIKVIDRGMYNANDMEIISPTGNSVILHSGYYPEMIPEKLWKTYAKLIYRRSWMTYLMLTRQDMQNILEMRDRNILLR